MRVRTQRLPIGYREVEYLESDGNQRISIGSGSIKKVYIKHSFNQIGSGRLTLQGGADTWWGTANNGTTLEYADGVIKTTSKTITAGTIYEVTITPNSLVFDGVTYTYTNTKSFSDFALFQIQNYSNFKFSGKIYNTKTYGENGSLINNFLPCLRTSDNKPGMYDVVNQTFYINQGTGEFAYGPYHDSYKTPIPALPSAYQRVEYIQSEGKTQWINTNYYPILNKTKVVADAVKDIGYSIFGSNSADFTFTGTNSGEGSHYAYYNGNYMGTGMRFTDRHLYIMDKNRLYIDGTLYGTWTSSSRTLDYPLGIFGRMTAKNPYNCTDRGNHKLYGLKIYEDDVLVRNFLPCYRKSDNVIGLYDTVGKQFYTNQGTGTFAKGNDVSNSLPCNAIVKTYGYNQLAMNGNFLNDKTNWVDYCSSTTVANGVAEITRTSTSATSSLHQDVVGNAGDKFYVRSTMWSDGAASCRLGLNGGISWSGTSTTSTDPVSFEVIKPISSTGTGFRIELFGLGDEGVKYYAKEVNAINLTDWYGAGKEPSTVAEFKQKFPNDYYGFCNKNLKLTQKMINAGQLYGYNQLLDYDTQYPTSVSGDNATFVKSGKYITLTKKDNTNYYSFELSTGTNAKAKYGDKIYIKFKFTNFVPALNGLTAGLGIAEYGPSGWLKNPGRAMTYTAGVYEYETIDSVRAETTTHVRAKILHTTGTGISGELLTAESCEIINLTEWFGAGNEPATVEEFKQKFPHDYYPYSLKSSLNAYQINAMAMRN